MVAGRASTLGDEGRIVSLQLNDLLSGVEQTKRLVLQDYLRPLRAGSVPRTSETLRDLPGSDLEDLARIGKEIGFPDMDEPAAPRGHRILSQAGRIPDSVRDDLVRHFGSLGRLLRASESDLIEVEGVGDTRAEQLRAYFDRLQLMADELDPLSD
jgi:diadenylate cyclase